MLTKPSNPATEAATLHDLARKLSQHPATSFVLFLAILLAAGLSIGRGIPGPFLLDDAIRIESMRIMSLDIQSLVRAIDSIHSGPLGRPVSIASLYLTKYLNGSDPGAFKFQNMLLHLITGVLAFWLIYRIAGTTAFSNHLSTRRGQAFFAALASGIWVLHPVHVSTVLYAVQRMTILSTLFTLAALVTYVILRQSQTQHAPVPGRHARTLAYSLLFGAFFLLAVLSKENAVLVPLYIILIEVLLFRFQVNDFIQRRYLYGFHIVYVAAPLLMGLIYFLLRFDSLLAGYAIRDFTLPERLATEGIIIWKYLFLFLTPRLSGMSLYHDSISTHSISDPWVIAAIASLAFTLLVLTHARRRAPALVFCIALFFASHLLESTIFPLELMFEHRNHFGTIGLSMALVLVIAIARNQLPGIRRATSAALLVFICLLGFQTAVRASVWSNKELLLRTTLSDHPRSDRAASELANIFFDRGHTTDARGILMRAIANPPHRYRTGLRLHLLTTYCSSKETPPAGLVDQIRKDLATEPMTSYAIAGLRTIWQQTTNDRCASISTDTINSIFAVAAENHDTRDSHVYLANYMAGSVLTYSGQYVDAISHYETALGYSSTVPVSTHIATLLHIADLQIHLDNIQEARTTIERTESILRGTWVKYPHFEDALSRQRAALIEYDNAT